MRGTQKNQLINMRILELWKILIKIAIGVILFYLIIIVALFFMLLP